MSTMTDSTVTTWDGAADAARFAALLLAPGACLEIRVPEPLPVPGRRVFGQAGWFDDPAAVAAAVAPWDARARAVYVTLNPVDPAILARTGPNRLAEMASAGNQTKDVDILARRWLLLDLDHRRPTGISATDAELGTVKAHARALLVGLQAEGWPEPVIGLSGNGVHLLYRIDLPRDDGGLVARVLAALAFRFDADPVWLEQRAANPSHLGKLFGTFAAKGASTADRPHRRARLARVPEPLEPVPAALLAAAAAWLPAKPRPARRQDAGRGDPIDVPAWLAARNIAVAAERPWNQGTKWLLAACPWNPEHADGAAFVVQFPSGAVAAGCLHASCAGNHWPELKALFHAEPARTGSYREPPHPAEPPRVPSSPGPAPTPSPNGRYHLTDLGNARRLLAAYAPDLRYVVEDAAWYVWDGARFRPDPPEAERRAQTLPDLLRAAASDEPDRDAAAALDAFAARCEARGRLDNALALARHGTEVAIRRAALDADPDVLNCPNGLLDLRSGSLRPSDRAALAGKLAGVPFDPRAEAPAWLDFLDRTFGGDEDLLAYVQRAAGYWLTGRTTEQVAFFLYGTGANGKTVFTRALRAVAAEYGAQADFASFSAEARDPSRFGLARLAGARLVTCAEARPGAPVDEAVLKQVTGGDPVTARAPYGDFFEFAPALKLVVACNHPPVVRSQDEGTWRRMRIIPFTRTIPEAERRGDFFEEVLVPDLPGVLAWAARGAASWYQAGLGTAGMVAAATGTYRADQDVLGLFFAERCVVGPDCSVGASELYAAYHAWAETRGERPWSQTAFGRSLAERSDLRRAQDDPASRRRRWAGVALQPDGAFAFARYPSGRAEN